MIDVRLVRDRIDATDLIARLRSDDCGAVSIFVGTVRDQNDGRPVAGIEYSAYEAMAVNEMREIAAEAARQFAVERIAVVHRLGALGVGDASIAIVSAHPHRGPAMAATGYIIEQVKRRVPIWKCELYVDGTREWIDPTRARVEASP